MTEKKTSARERFIGLLRAATRDGTLVKLTLGKPRPGAAEPSLKNLFVRPVTLNSGPHLSFVWRHATRDITKNFLPAKALREIEPLIGAMFLDAHLFTPAQTAQFETDDDDHGRLRVKTLSTAPAPAGLPADLSAKASATAEALPALPSFSEVGAAGDTHDRAKTHLIPADAPWLRALGVTDERGRPRTGMADKFRQIEKFAELLTHLLAETNLPGDRELSVTDMGSGKGYLTFATAALLGPRARVRGIECRGELVDLCNRVARETNFSNLEFITGDITGAPLPAQLDVLIALHACDTATDDALARGIAAGAALLVVAPCCQKELRRQLTAPAVLAPALRHGIFQERHAEFATDALRALLLEWAGYRTTVFEFISTDHTAKNVMIVAEKSSAAGNPNTAKKLRAFAHFYGIRRQRLAEHLDFALAAPVTGNESQPTENY
ncbi:MAG TPA: SAM-dependent methyltransferase [Opitutaceae bacterium]|jgi:SAM-dependent methyltransferase|nr:SAM-dependent methyltransferase [Opitutaceae bacterium]